jgi:hypothetical protein
VTAPSDIELRAERVYTAAEVIGMLITIARVAHHALDDAEVVNPTLAYVNHSALELALDALDELPDDRPGYTMSGAMRAEWALRYLFENSTTPLTAAAHDVLAERQRQIASEGWTPEHDDTHADGSLSEAAACYAMGDVEASADNETVAIWPWSLEWWKPEGGRRRMLIKAGALILAEIERLDRLSTTRPQEAR